MAAVGSAGDGPTASARAQARSWAARSARDYPCCRTTTLPPPPCSGNWRAPAATVTKKAVRIVSTACSNTEIVCALGCAGLLVGVDDHSDYPVEVVKRLPRVGPDLGIDVERVKALQPDLVLASLTVPGHE